MNLFDFDYLTVVDEDLNSWCGKYKLTPKESKCMDCGSVIKTTIPAFGKGWRGLVAETCICGKHNDFHHFVLTHDADIPVLIRILA